MSADPENTLCPACGAHTLRIEQRLTAQRIGTFSLAGVQTKVTASYRPWLVCDNCGVEAEGKSDRG